jgi:Heterokaryon incompatibility protein (HET)
VGAKTGGWLFWVDTICIYQTDTGEKTRQVRMMQEIYKQAETVIIWLGLEEPGDQKAYALATDLGELLGDTFRDYQAVLQTAQRMDTYDLEPNLQALLDQEDGWIALVKLLKRLWFSRVWVIQELVPARSTRTMIGDFELDVLVVLNVSALIGIFHPLLVCLFRIPGGSSNNNRLITPVSALRTFVAQRYHDAGPLDLTELLYIAQYAKATEPKDHIFAVLGLTSEIPLDFIDYDRDQQEILMDLATRLLGHSPNPIQVLCWPQVKSPSTSLPSWATDWTSASKPLMPISGLIPVDESKEYGEADSRVEKGDVRVAAWKKTIALLLPRYS